MQPGDGHQSTPGIHRVAAPFTVLSRGSLMLCSQLLCQPFQLYGETYSFGDLTESPESLCLPCMVGRGLLPQV